MNNKLEILGKYGALSTESGQAERIMLAMEEYKNQKINGEMPLSKEHICFDKGHSFFEVNRYRNHQSEFIDRKCSRCGFEESSQYDNIFI